jgi:hypothetical protein
MATKMEADVERGLRLAAELPDIMPDDADARIRSIYEEIQQTLRVPIVNTIFRTLANYPEYLEQAWAQLRPLANQRRFEQAADALRARALLQSAPTLPALDIEGMEDGQRLRAFNDTIHYVLPKLQLVAGVLEAASFTDSKGANAQATEALDTLPVGIAQGTTKVSMVQPEQAQERVRAVLESIKQRHGYPMASSYYRGAANWPDFLGSVWERLSPLVGSSEYETRKAAVIEHAEAYARDWPRLTIHVAESQQMDIRLLLAGFRRKFIPEMLLEMVLIKYLTDGAEAAGASRFSAAA